MFLPTVTPLLNELERENGRLRLIVSDLTLEEMILNEAQTEKYQALRTTGALLIMSLAVFSPLNGEPVEHSVRVDPVVNIVIQSHSAISGLAA